MATENLKFVVEGEVGNGLSNINKLVASIDKLTAVLSKTQKGFDRTDKVVHKAGTVLDQYGNQVNQAVQVNRRLAAGSANMSRAVQRTITPLNNVKKTSGAANFAVLSLSQGVQDASFGFIGVQNNITQFTQSFIQLKQQTGSTKAAFKAFGATLLGPGGVFLAISAVVSAITYFSMRTSSAEKEVNEFKSSIDSLNDSLGTLGDAFASGLSSVADRITQLKLLYNATQNQNLATKERISAAKKLKEVESDAFGKFSAHAIVVGDASEAYKELAENVIKYARAQGLADTITENATKQFEIQGKVLDLSDQINKIKNKNKAAIDKFNESFDKIFPESVNRNLRGRIAIINEFLRSPSQVNKAISKGLVTKQDITSLRGLSESLSESAIKLDEYEDKINTLATTYGKFFKTNQRLKGLVNVGDYIKSLNKETGNLSKKTKDAFSVSDTMKSFYAELQKINQEAKTFHWGADKIQTERIQAAQNALQSLIDNGIDPSSKAFLTLQGLFDAFSVSPLASGIQSAVTSLSPLAKIIANLNNEYQQIQRKVGLGLITPEEGQKQRGGILQSSVNSAISQGVGFGSNDFKAMVNDLKAFNEQQRQAQQDTQNWGKAANILSSTFSQIFDTIPTGENIFDSLTKSVGRLIVKLISAASAAALLNAITGGAAGGFMKLFGSISGIPFGGSHAAGGFIPRPELAIVGDAPGGEWVLNQQQMHAILNNSGPRKIEVSGRLIGEGTNLVAVIDSTNNKTLRRNG